MAYIMPMKIVQVLVTIIVTIAIRDYNSNLVV